MSITLAKTAGFCFGVDRAVKKVNELLDNGIKVATFGPIIHNDQVVDELKRRGVVIVERVEDTPEGYTLVIRAHGVPKSILDEIQDKKLEHFDATCPFVTRIHKIALDNSNENTVFLIAGNREHPEIQGIIGHTNSPCYVFNNEDELDEIIDSHAEIAQKDIKVVVQTTFSVDEWQKCVEKIEKAYTKAIVFDTICRATHERQEEATVLSTSSDVMIVVGGKSSSNTEKLRSLCEQYAMTYHIETAKDLDAFTFDSSSEIGVTAGASTPATIIKEVLQTMSDMMIDTNETLEEEVTSVSTEETIEKLEVKETSVGTEETIEKLEVKETSVGTEETIEKLEVKQTSVDTDETVETPKTEGELSFEEALEESLKQMSTDQKVRGEVVAVSPTEVQVDISRKHAGFIPLDELTADPTLLPEDVVQVGDIIDLIIMKTNDAEGTVMLSKRRFDAIKAWDDIIKSEENDTILEGKITDIIKGGLLVTTGAVRVFIPASLATYSRHEPLEELRGQNVKFKIIETNKARRRAVGSIKAVLMEGRKEKEDEFWENAQEGQEYDGTVKSLTSYGAFVDIGGIDGMIHISELSWVRIKHPSDVLKVGDKITVTIKSLDRDKHRISLGYKNLEDNPWEVLQKDYPEGTTVEAKIVGLTTFGAFAQVIPGIDGLIHISQLSLSHIEKPQDVVSVGDVVKVEITAIDFDKKRVSLSIKTLLEDQISKDLAREEAEEETTDEVVEDAIEDAIEDAVQTETVEEITDEAEAAQEIAEEVGEVEAVKETAEETVEETAEEVAESIEEEALEEIEKE